MPVIANIDEYNRELLMRCMILHKRKHHRTKEIYEDNYLINVIEKDFEDFVTINLEYPIIPKRVKVRCFIWDTTGGMKPYYKSFEVK